MGSVADLAFCPDVQLLYTASFDETIRTYLVDIEALVELTQRRGFRPLTAEECQQYLHIEPCPIES